MSTARLQRNTLIGFAASILLAAGKFVAGVVGYSSALIADAVESLADTVGSIVVWHAIRVSAKPPDEDHPYGHGKAEALAALAVGAMLLLASLVIVVKAFQEMMTPHAAPAWWTLIVLLAVVVVKEGLFRLLLGGAAACESQAAHADAWHHRSDAITSVAAFIGVSIALWGPSLTGLPNLVLADEVAALVASGIIVHTAIRLIRGPLEELLDSSPRTLIPRIAEVASEVEGVQLVEKVQARKSGRFFFVDMHLHVDAELSVGVAHSISHDVKARVLKAIPAVADVLIHIEPAGDAAVRSARRTTAAHSEAS